MPSKHLCFEVKTSSNNCQPLMKKTGSSALEQSIKVRKPYTITKQRERWTDDEHAKFLEALKRYGRAWRQIEEHVGTKSSVQIRSHAQKFFTKVVRESVDDNPSGAQNIDIPPPRPKKKPMHPYPRKLGNSPKISVTEKQEWSSFAKLSVPGQNSPSVQPVSEQDSLSPVSVLSAVRYDTFGSSGSDVINCSSTSPASLSEHENGCQSAITSVEEQDESLLLNKSNMEIDMGNDDKEAPAKTLKLFGATVMVASIKNRVQVLEQSAADSFGEESCKSNLWPSMVTPMFYLSHNSQGNSSSTSAADAFPMPWLWAITSHQSFASKQDQSASYIEVADERGARKDSSTAPDLELSIGDSTFNDRKAPVMKLRPSETSAFRSLRCASDKPARGFVPYRRCVDDNLEGQGVELCL